MATALLIIRLVVGLSFVAHGCQKLFGWFGGHGLEGTGGFMDSLGFRPGKAHATLAGVGETGGGALLTLGLLTPLAVVAIVGVMVNAIVAVHLPNGFFTQDGGIEYPFVLASIAIAVAFSGAGTYSLDHAFALGLRGWAWGLGAAAVGFGCAAIALAFRRPEAAAAPATDEPAEPGQAPKQAA